MSVLSSGKEKSTKEAASPSFRDYLSFSRRYMPRMAGAITMSGNPRPQGYGTMTPPPVPGDITIYLPEQELSAVATGLEGPVSTSFGKKPPARTAVTALDGPLMFVFEEVE